MIHEFVGKANRFGAIELSVLLARNGCLVGITEPRGGFDKGLQHRLQIEGRPADDLEYISRGGLLLQGFTYSAVRCSTFCSRSA